MNISMQGLTLTVILLSGCTPVKVMMKVDSTLQANAVVYKLNYADSLADKISGNRLNMSFGPYRVSDAHLSWTGTGTRAENPSPIFSNKSTKTSGSTTTTTEISAGPSSLFGYTRPAAEGEPSITNTSRSISYKFKAAQQSSWDAYCTHDTKQRITEYKNSNDIEILSSVYTCQYKQAGNNETWILSVETNGMITMTKKGRPNFLSAHSTGGSYVTADGKPVKLTTANAGYTWHQTKNGHIKNIGAISVKEETPRIWLDKGNPVIINHVLSMANTGLMIYSWEIQH